jgi:DNA-3-methyladenine glycosylase
MRGKRLGRTFFRRDSLELAPLLLHKVLVHGECAGRIVEVEAYREDDEASHSYRGRTARNGTMFGPPGLLYVYFSYGMHWCANVVCGAEGTGAAVLLRALEPLAGIERMRERRPAARTERDLCSGPGKLTRALGLERSHDGWDLARGAGDGPFLLDDGTPPPARPGRGPRIGITKATEKPWRFFAEGSPFVSRGVRRSGASAMGPDLTPPLPGAGARSTGGRRTRGRTTRSA